MPTTHDVKAVNFRGLSPHVRYKGTHQRDGLEARGAQVFRGTWRLDLTTLFWWIGLGSAGWARSIDPGTSRLVTVLSSPETALEEFLVRTVNSSLEMQKSRIIDVHLHHSSLKVSNSQHLFPIHIQNSRHETGVMMDFCSSGRELPS